MLRDLLRRAARSLDLDGRTILVAVSGGVDSVALAHGLAWRQGRTGGRVVLGHVNHGLRGAASEADQRLVERLGTRLATSVAVERVEPETLRRVGSSRERPTRQESARRLRYAALYRMARANGCDRIATAHTADDQAETLLLRLLRGTGPDGLGGIPERSTDGVVVRPFLAATRADVLEFARSERIDWREDASNRNPGYARNRLRHSWLPGLAREFNPRLLRVLSDLAEAQRRDSEWLAWMVEREAERRFEPEGAGMRIDTKDWSELPAGLARRLVREALRRMDTGRDVSRIHIERMLDFLGTARPRRRLELPGGLALWRDRDGFHLAPSWVFPPGAC